MPGYVNYGMILFAPRRVPAFPMFRLAVAGGLHKGSVLSVGHRRLGQIAVREVQGVLGLLIALGTFVPLGITAHEERAESTP
jgi:hypothetical protein